MIKLDSDVNVEIDDNICVINDKSSDGSWISKSVVEEESKRVNK